MFRIDVRGDRHRTASALRLAVLMLVGAFGCGSGPHNFRALSNPAAIVRARSVGYGDRLPDQKVVPALIGRLVDPDPVVRLTAFEELKQRTGQDFGFVPWGRPEDNVRAVEKWRAWWAEQEADLSKTRKKL